MSALQTMVNRALGRRRVPVRFTLQYDGPVPPAANSNRRVGEKQVVRRAFHGQLAELWRLDPTLAVEERHIRRPEATLKGERIVAPSKNEATQAYSWELPLGGYRFVPLVTSSNGLGCALDIKFLRRGTPGSVFNAGDIDGRLKLVFDALTIPTSPLKFKADQPRTNGERFYCLLEDDSLIRSVSVDTAQLLTPALSADSDSDAYLYIDVTVTQDLF